MEISVFIQVGDWLGMWPTIATVVITAIVGVNLLKQQGFKVWVDIQNKMAQGQIPALEMASAAQLLFAGALLLTPGFVTDIVGFLLMFPLVRSFVAHQLIKRWRDKVSVVSQHSAYYQNTDYQKPTSSDNESVQSKPRKINKKGRTIDGEFEDQSQDKQA